MVAGLSTRNYSAGLERVGDVEAIRIDDLDRAHDDAKRQAQARRNDHRALGVTQDLDGDLYVLTTQRGGPAGDTGEVLALGPAEDAEAAGDAERDDATAGLPWWAWLAIAGAIAAAFALAIIARRRRGGLATQR